LITRIRQSRTNLVRLRSKWTPGMTGAAAPVIEHMPWFHRIPYIDQWEERPPQSHWHPAPLVDLTLPWLARKVFPEYREEAAAYQRATGWLFEPMAAAPTISDGMEFDTMANGMEFDTMSDAMEFDTVKDALDV